MSKAYRIAEMETALAVAKGAPDQVRPQRAALEKILHHAHFAQIPPFDWLIGKLNEVSDSYKVVSVVDFQRNEPAFTEHECPSCGKPHKSQAALSAHGPKRCAARRSEKGDAHD
jgi:hypothetical protein